MNVLNKYICLLVSCLLMFTTGGYCQDEALPENQSTFPFQNKRAVILSFEPIGIAGFMGLHIDSRFDKKHNGLGFKMGIGFFPVVSMGGNNEYSYPNTYNFQLNYLFGKGQHIFETGLGLGFIKRVEPYPSLILAYKRYSKNTRLVLNVGVFTYYYHPLPTIGIGFRL